LSHPPLGIGIAPCGSDLPWLGLGSPCDSSSDMAQVLRRPVCVTGLHCDQGRGAIASLRSLDERPLRSFRVPLRAAGLGPDAGQLWEGQPSIIGPLNEPRGSSRGCRREVARRALAMLRRAPPSPCPQGPKRQAGRQDALLPARARRRILRPARRLRCVPSDRGTRVRSLPRSPRSRLAGVDPCSWCGSLGSRQGRVSSRADSHATWKGFPRSAPPGPNFRGRSSVAPVESARPPGTTPSPCASARRS
jgi:hypothetical protein